MGIRALSGREVLASGLMPATVQALTDLIEISAQIQAAVVFDREGAVVASTLEEERARIFASSALGLLRAAEEARPDEETGLAQLDAAFADGSVFLVADDDHVIAATTAPEPTVGLVFYDLKSCLRGLAEGPEPAKPKRVPAKRTTTARTTRKKADEGS